MQSTLPKYDVVLLGAGHTNAHVLRMWRMQPPADVRLTVVSNFSLATYSGMLPGTLAGLYPSERMQIDLVRLCAAVGARFVQAQVVGLDVAARQLLLAERPPIPFDVLSIGVGSVPRSNGNGEPDARLLAIKPMQTFLARLADRLAALRAHDVGRAFRVAVVGAGAGGVEIAFCLPAFLRRHWPELRYELCLVDGHAEILRGYPPKTAALARREFERRGVQLVLGRAVGQIAAGQISFVDGSQREVDLALWATSAAAPSLLSALPLPKDDDGFLLTRPTLQTTADAPIFAVGDAGSCPRYPTPKAGVYAVRQGPVLWQNIRRLLNHEPLLEYIPQRGFLSLLATGDRRAILSYKGMSFHAGWCWRLKNYIDSRFMDKYQDYRPMTEPRPAVEAGTADAAMRCAGCGGKVGGSILANVLRRLDVPASEHVVLGLDRPDDAAIIRPPGGRAVAATVDFFTPFLDDPYLVGRIAALNALSDVYALGAVPLAALALATIPLGRPRQQEQLLYELLAGGLDELRRAGATLVGGHTIEAGQMTIGYTLLADVGDEPPRLKSGLRPGDRLVLTKPLGSGVLLAAHARAQCRAEWMESLLAVMLESNRLTAAVAQELKVLAMTDITGFGLAGHLLEMLQASDAAATLDLAAIPLLPGAQELLLEGLESTLAPANRAAEAEIENRRAGETHRATGSRPGAKAASPLPAAYRTLFDPQTSGGLLLGVAEAQLAACLARLQAARSSAAAVIGTVVPHEPGRPRLRLE